MGGKLPKMHQLDSKVTKRETNNEERRISWTYQTYWTLGKEWWYSTNTMTEWLDQIENKDAWKGKSKIWGSCFGMRRT